MRLIFNACESKLQLLLTNDNIIICAQEWTVPNSSTEILTPAISQMLACLNLSPTDINSIACVNGPGSFTGIRLTLATASAMRKVLKIPLNGINYLQALALTGQIYLYKRVFTDDVNAYAYLSNLSGNAKILELAHLGIYDNVLNVNSLCWVLSHAKRDHVHAQLYEFNKDLSLIPRPVRSIEILSIEQICQKMQELSHNAKVYCLGSGLVRNSTLIRQKSPKVHYLNLDNVCNEALNILAQIGAYEHIDLEPIYTRQCDAIENLTNAAIKQGYDPEERHAELDNLLQRPVEPSKK